MSRVVDNRVVEMQFDNANFEKNVGTSLSTLDKLKSALHFKGVDDNFSSVERSAGLLGKTFSALEEVAIGSLRRIGSQVTEWAEKTIKEMSGVNNMITGFSKFSTITKSSATLQAQGFEMQNIEEQLRKLNWFTDETSYNLSDMVDNISKFTATGQNLEDSSDAMMGIALWAAMSGQNAQTASRAMYQLSQAMSTYMKREDWRSIQNANMDTAEFRQKALDAAVALGTLRKNANGTYTSIVKGIKKEGKEAFTQSQFVEKLTAGEWFTKDVMMSVYRDYAAAVNQIYEYIETHRGATVQDAIEALGTSLDEFGKKAFLAGQQARTWEDAVESVKDALSTKWMSVFQVIFGNSKKATEFFTDLSYAFYDQFVEPMNKTLMMFENWGDKFGSEKLKNGILNTLESILNITNKIRETSGKIFWGDQIAERKKQYEDENKAIRLANEALEDFGEKEKLQEKDTSDAAIIADLKAEKLLKLTEGFEAFSEKILGLSNNLGRFKRIIAGVFSIVDLGKQAFSGLFDSIKALFSGGTGNLRDKIIETLASAGDFFVKIDTMAKKTGFFKNAFTFLLTPLMNLKKAFIEFKEAFTPEFMKRWDHLKEKILGLDIGFQKAGKDGETFIDKIKSKWLGLFTNFDAKKAVDIIFNAVNKVKALFYEVTGIEPGTLFDVIQEQIYSAGRWINDFIPEAKKKALELWAVIKSTFNDAVEWTKTHKEIIVTTVKDALHGIGGFFSGFWDGVKSLFGKSEDGTSGFKKFVDSLKSIGKVLGTVVGYIVKLFTPLFEGLGRTFETMNADNVGEWVAGGGLAAIGIGIVKFANALKKNSILKGISEILESFGGVLDSFAHSLDAKALKDAAIAVAILVGAILVLISLPMEDVTNAGFVLAAFITVLSGSLKKIMALNSTLSINGKGLSKSSSSGGVVFLEVAIGLVAIALALRMIAKIPKDDLYTAAFTIAILVSVVALAIKMIAKMYENKGDTKKILAYKSGNVKIGSGPAGVILAFALLLLAVTHVVSKIAPIAEQDLMGFIGTLAVIGVVLVSMWRIIKDFDKVEIKTGVIFTILAFVLAISIIASSIGKLANSVPKKDQSMLITAGAIVEVILLTLAALTAIASKVDFTGFGKFSSGMLLISAAIAIMSYVVYKLAQGSKEGQYEEALKVIGIIAVIFGAFAALAGLDFKFFKVDPDRIFEMAAALVVLSVAFGAMAGVMYALSLIKNIWDSVIGLIAIGAVFAGLTVLASKFGPAMETLGKFFVMLAGSVALLAIGFLAVAAAMKLLSDETVDVKKAAKNISDFIVNILDNLAGWILKTVRDIVRSILEIAVGAVLGVVDAIIDLLDDLLKDNRLAKIVTALCKVAVIVIGGVAANAGVIVYALGNLILELLSSLGTWLQENASAVSRALDSVITGLIDVILSLFDPLGEKLFGQTWGVIKDKIENVVKVALYSFATIWLVGWVASIVTAMNPIIAVLLAIAALISVVTLGIESLEARNSSVNNVNKWEEEDPRKQRLIKYVQAHRTGPADSALEYIKADDYFEQGYDVDANGNLYRKSSLELYQERKERERDYYANLEKIHQMEERSAELERRHKNNYVYDDSSIMPTANTVTWVPDTESASPSSSSGIDLDVNQYINFEGTGFNFADIYRAMNTTNGQLTSGLSISLEDLLNSIK